MSEPMDLDWHRAQHPLARNGLCTFHQGDDGPCEARALIDEMDDLRAEMADMVPRDWHGLMAILDYAYPEAIFPTTEDAMTRDPGPRIVSLIRQLDRLRDEVADRANVEADLRAQLAETKAAQA